MKKKYLLQFLLFPIIILCLAGCKKEAVEKDIQTVTEAGITYTFQLPRAWKKQKDFKKIYGHHSAFGAEDTRSKSGMSVLVFPKDEIDETGFGERTRKELASKNGYKNVEDVYMEKYTVNDAPAYKFTFESRFGEQKVWSHFYAIFTKNGVIEAMFYSAQDSSYKDRAKLIGASMDTVKETNYDKNAASASDDEADKIDIKNEQFSAVITGIRTISGESEKQLFVLRYQLTNLSDQPLKPVDWRKHFELKQDGKILDSAQLPENTTSYDTKELVEAGEKEIGKGETVEAVLLYSLPKVMNVQLLVGKEVSSPQQVYTLLVSNS